MCALTRARENPDIDRDYRSPRYAASTAILPRRRNDTDHDAARARSTDVVVAPRAGGGRLNGTAGFISRSTAGAPRDRRYIDGRADTTRGAINDTRLRAYIRTAHVSHDSSESYFSPKHHSLARHTISRVSSGLLVPPYRRLSLSLSLSLFPSPVPRAVSPSCSL